MSEQIVADHAAAVVPGCTQDTMLQVAAVTCLCKLMCVSSEFCEDNLQLLFTLLEKSPLEVVRANIAIAIGDMAICFNRYDTSVSKGLGAHGARGAGSDTPC